MNRNGKTDNIFCFSSGNDECYDTQDITNTFNNFFLSTADNSTPNIKNSNNHNKHKDTNPLYYLPQLFSDILPANLLSLNFEKTSLIPFLINNISHIPISVGCDYNIKYNISNRKFLGTMIDNTLTWKTHIEMIILKLNLACFAVRAFKRFVKMDTLKMVYYSFFSTVINYGIIFSGNSSYSNSIFKLQKNIIRIIMGVGIRDSCRQIFKILNILPLISQYIFSPPLFVVNNKNQF